jgi:hypothetical protein
MVEELGRQERLVRRVIGELERKKEKPKIEERKMMCVIHCFIFYLFFTSLICLCYTQICFFKKLFNSIEEMST